MQIISPGFIIQVRNIASINPTTTSHKHVFLYVNSFGRSPPIHLFTNLFIPVNIDIQTKDFKTAPGVTLDSEQKKLVGSVLDLFKGLPTKEKLSLWSDNAVFEDPLTDARGRAQFEPQWVSFSAQLSL